MRKTDETWASRLLIRGTLRGQKPPRESIPLTLLGTYWTRKRPVRSLSLCYKGGYTRHLTWNCPTDKATTAVVTYGSGSTSGGIASPPGATPPGRKNLVERLLMVLLWLCPLGSNTCWVRSTWHQTTASQPTCASECIWRRLWESCIGAGTHLGQIQISVETRVLFTRLPKEAITLLLAPGSVVLPGKCRKLILSCVCFPHSTQDIC